jgi:hypothetical protein
MNRKNITITLLSLSAAVLLTLNWLLPSASAQVTIKERDYQAVTARVRGGGDGLYILDNRTGQIGVFTYDAGRRTIVPQAIRSVADGFVTR